MAIEPVPDETHRDFYEAVMAGEYDNSAVVDAAAIKREVMEYRATQEMSGRVSRWIAAKMRGEAK